MQGYKRQTTADSAFSSDLEGSLEHTRFYPCKRNIEEEEAEAEARVRSMLPVQAPHPALSGLPPPSPQVLVHVQCSGKGVEARQAITIINTQCRIYQVLHQLDRYLRSLDGYIHIYFLLTSAKFYCYIARMHSSNFSVTLTNNISAPLFTQQFIVK